MVKTMPPKNKKVRAFLFATITFLIVMCLGTAIGFAYGSYEQSIRIQERLKNSPDGVIYCGTGIIGQPESMATLGGLLGIPVGSIAALWVFVKKRGKQGQKRNPEG